VFDADTLAPLGSQSVEETSDEPSFSADSRWLAIAERVGPWRPSGVPQRVAEWIGDRVRPAAESVRVIRLADGKTVGQLNGRTSPTLTTDGLLWTVTRAGEADEATLIAERWSPDPPGPPAALVGATALIFGAAGWSLCRSRQPAPRSAGPPPLG
jgi:hypothetical protein